MRRIKKLKRKVRSAKRRVGKLLKTPPKLKFYFGWHYKHSKVVDNRMLLESFHGKNISDSPLAVLEELVSSGDAKLFDIYYSTNDMKRDRAFVKANHLPVKLVDVNSRRYPRVLATSKYLLNNSSFPVYFIRKPEQNYVQTWHGTPLKTLGKQMRLGMESMYNVQHNFIQANCLTFPNDFTREAIMRDYNLEQLYTGKVAMVGYPRNSVFLKGPDQALREACGLEGYQTFAYMPTWRGSSNHAVSIERYGEQVRELLETLDQALRDDQKLFVNFHSMVASSIELGEYDHIFPFPATVSNYEFLSQVDVLITDYSSVFFDYALTGKPIILYAYDLEEYTEERGFYFPMTDLPFPIVRDVDTLVDMIRTGNFGESAEERAAFDERYLSYDSLDNPRNVLDLLLAADAVDAPAIDCAAPGNWSGRMMDYAPNKQHPWRVFDPTERKTEADLRSMFEYPDPENDLLLVWCTGFGKKSSAFVYDNYRDRLNYLFVTRTVPRTVLEDLIRRKSPAMRAKLKQRNYQRLFSDLNIVNEYREYCVIENGASYSRGSSRRIYTQVQTRGSRVVLDFDDDRGAFEKVFITRGRTVVWNRALTAEEIENRHVEVDVAPFMCDLDLNIQRGERLVFGLSYRDYESGHVRAGMLVEYRAGEKRQGPLSHYLSPIVLSPDSLPLDGLRSDFRFEHSMVGRAQGRSIALSPYWSSTGHLSLYVTYLGDAARTYYRATMTRVSMLPEGAVRVQATLKPGPFTVCGMVLHSRAESIPITHKLPTVVEKSGSRLLITAQFKARDYSFDGTFWDVMVEIDEGFGFTSLIYVKTIKEFRRTSYLIDRQVNLGDGTILFPYTAKGDKLAFTHREWHRSDTPLTKVKEVAAFSVFAAGHAYWKRKRMWLVYEKYCSLAQDNAYYFFKYCMEEGDPAMRKNIFYVIDKRSPDYENVKKYGRNVVDFMSFRHMLYIMVAKIYIASDSKVHLYQWRAKPSIVRRRIRKHKIFFLQHGVTALKRVDFLFGRKGSSPMTYFLTTSPREQEIVKEHFGYSEGRAPILGFSRWDVLENHANSQAPTILLMPTWRSWLEEQSDDVFMASDYYKTYSSLVRNEQLSAMLKQHNATLKFFIHPKLASYMKNFSSELENVELIETGTRPLNELIMECSMLITDYSSVCWDVLFMNKPVVYYQFDQDRYKADIGTYIDFETELPGSVCKDEDSCVALVAKYVEADFAMTAQDKERVETFLPIKDRENRKRTYDFLIEKGF